MRVPAIEQKLGQLQLRTRHPVEHLLAGEYRSVFKGSGMDFDEIRPYNPGDEVRSIDWNVTARTGKPHVKRYIEERELAVWLLVDISASCRCAQDGRTKWDVLGELAALLVFSAVHNNDRAGLILFSDRIERIIPPRKGRQHALRLLTELLGAEPTGRGTDPGPAFDALSHLARRRTLVFLLSDFLFDIDRLLLGPVGFRQDLVAIAVNHPAEIDPPACGLAYVADSESGDTMLCDLGADSRENYLRSFAARRASLRAELEAVRADLVELDTLADCTAVLARFFRNRLRKTADETGG